MLGNVAGLGRRLVPVMAGAPRRWLWSKRDIPIKQPWRQRGHWDRSSFNPGHMIHEVEHRFEELFKRLDHLLMPKASSAYYVNPRNVTEAASMTEVARVHYDRSDFAVEIDVRHYLPEELKVKLTGNSLTVIGRHEPREDEHGFVAREFHRKFVVPDDVHLETMKSTITEDGILQIHADVYGPEKPEERIIEIREKPKKDDDKNEDKKDN